MFLHYIYLLICRWVHKLFQFPGYCEQWSSEYGWEGISVAWRLVAGVYVQMVWLSHTLVLFSVVFFFWGTSILIFKTGLLLLLLLFWNTVSLCSFGCPRMYYVNQAGIELRGPSASALAGIKGVCHRPSMFFFVCVCVWVFCLHVYLYAAVYNNQRAGVRSV